MPMKDEEWVEPRDHQNLSDIEKLMAHMNKRDFRYYWYKFWLAVDEWFSKYRYPMATWEFTLRGVYSKRTEVVRARSNLRTQSEYDLIGYYEAKWDEPVYVVTWRELDE